MHSADLSIHDLRPAFEDLRAASRRYRAVFEANYPFGSPIAWRTTDGRVRQGRVNAHGFVGGKLCVRQTSGRSQWIGGADILTPDEADDLTRAAG